MKELDESYIIQDEKENRLPVEIYDFWESNGKHYRYTSGDSLITFEGYEYIPAPIKRTSVGVNEAVDNKEVTINLYYLSKTAVKYLLFNPMAITHVRILKIFRDMDPYVSEVKFVGAIKKPSFNGITGSLVCSGFDHYTKVPIPRDRFQPSCNAFVYDGRCKLNLFDYRVTIVPTAIDSNGLFFSSDSLIDTEDSYFVWGYIDTGEDKRMIVKVENSYAYLRYPIQLIEGQSIDLYPGCNGLAETCFEKYGNLDNFRGQDEVPVDNPISWI